MINYETERLILRNYRSTDVQDYFAYMSLESTAEHEDFDPFTLEQCEKAVSERLKDDNYWVAEQKVSGIMIGDLSFSKNDFDTYEIAYDFNEAYHGNGYATEAAKKLLEHIFRVLDGRRIIAGCNEGNTASRRLMERLGMRQEAFCIDDISFKKDDEGNPIYISSYYYALLKREWLNKEACDN